MSEKWSATACPKKSIASSLTAWYLKISYIGTVLISKLFQVLLSSNLTPLINLYKSITLFLSIKDKRLDARASLSFDGTLQTATLADDNHPPF